MTAGIPNRAGTAIHNGGGKQVVANERTEYSAAFSKPRHMASGSSQRSEDVEVLIIGGSIVGLSTAMLLRLNGVDCLTVERHTGTAIHPRAGHFHLRTVEILRSVGLEEVVQRGSVEQYYPDGGINNVESLAGREIASYFPNLNAGVEEFSPTIRLFIDQDALEPILRARAEELGARLRLTTSPIPCCARSSGWTGPATGASSSST